MPNSDSSADVESPIPNSKRILVVDDEPNIVRLIKVNLERNGYEVETAGNGLQALAKIREKKPDLLISDIMMPEMDGIELIEAIRSDDRIADLPIIGMGAKAADKDFTSINSLMSRGANKMVIKPFNPKELIAFVNLMLLNPPVKDKI